MSTVQVHKRHHFTGHKNAIYGLAPGRQAGTVLSAAGDGIIAEWDVVNGGDAQLLARVPTQVFSVVHMPAYELVVAGQMNGGIHVMNTRTNEEIRHLAKHTGSIFYQYYDEERQRLLAAGGDGLLSVWTVPDFQLLHTVQLSENHLRYLTVSPDGNTLAVACSGNYIHLLHAENYQVLQQWAAHDNSVFSLLFLPDDALVSGSRDAYLKIWAPGDPYQLTHAIPAHLFTVNDIAGMENLSFFASAGRDKHVKLWDASTFALLKVIDHEKMEGHTHSVNRLLWLPAEQALVTAGDDRSIMVWDIARN